MEIRILFYGKLPHFGDFISRNIDHNQIQLIDRWMSAGMSRLSRSCDDWLADYLQAPVWCFMLPAGIWGESPICGALMPSVDRVGRYFPFIVLTEMAESSAQTLLQLSRLASAMPCLLNADIQGDEVASLLQELLLRPVGQTGDSQYADNWPKDLADYPLFDVCYWWSDGFYEGDRCCVSTHGLPDASLFTRLFSR